MSGRRPLTALAAVLLVLLGPACIRTGGERQNNLGRYCDRLDQLEDDREPDAGELDELIRVAPAEIKDEVRAVVEAGNSPYDDIPAARALLGRSRTLCAPTTSGS
ncbi:MAG: hypothetical protein QOG82_1656 [Actinomycetota bacterium]|nr:hypothetical protein [Actinomycetota bacterium]